MKENKEKAPTIKEAYVKPSMKVFEMEVEGAILQASAGTEATDYEYDSEGWS